MGVIAKMNQESKKKKKKYPISFRTAVFFSLIQEKRAIRTEKTSDPPSFKIVLWTQRENKMNEMFSKQTKKRTEERRLQAFGFSHNLGPPGLF